MCLRVTKPSNRKLPFISEMLLLNVFFLWVLMSAFIIGRECECWLFCLLLTRTLFGRVLCSCQWCQLV